MKNFLLICSLIFAPSILAMQESPPQRRVQIQAQVENVEQQYQRLFLDDFEKLVLEGRNAEAAALAKRQEDEFARRVSEDARQNGTLFGAKYRQSQPRKHIEEKEKFQPNFFKLFGKSSDKLIEKFQKNIYSLETTYKERLARIESLRKKVAEESDGPSRVYDESTLKRLEEGLKDYRADTDAQIRDLRLKIDFINAYPEIFVIKPIPRSAILGVRDPVEFYADGSKIKKGQGVTVGVIDVFAPCEQVSRISNHAVNPDFFGRQCFIGAGRTHEASHGLHVAGIIVCDLASPEEVMPIGVADGAKFEYINFSSLSDRPPARVYVANKGKRNERTIKIPYEPKRIAVPKMDWTPEEMAKTLEYFSREEQDPRMTDWFEMQDYQSNPILASSSRIFNLSLTLSDIKTSRQRPTLSNPEHPRALYVLYHALKDGKKLLVKALGMMVWNFLQSFSSD